MFEVISEINAETWNGVDELYKLLSVILSSAFHTLYAGLSSRITLLRSYIINWHLDVRKGNSVGCWSFFVLTRKNQRRHNDWPAIGPIMVVSVILHRCDHVVSAAVEESILFFGPQVLVAKICQHHWIQRNELLYQLDPICAFERYRPEHHFFFLLSNF